MHDVRQRLLVGFGLALCSAAPVWAQDSVKSSPPDLTPYARPAISADTAAPRSAPQAPAGANLMRIDDAVVNNTNSNLQNTDTFNDGETSIAINPANRNEIVMTAFSGSWGTNSPLWVSLDGGRTWTKEFTVPVPPGVSGTSGCPCDQTLDYGSSGVLFGTFLTSSPDNLYSGSTSDPTSAPSWAWWLSAGVAQQTNLAPTSSGNADQPWLMHNRGTTNASSQNVYVAYDDFGTNPVSMRVSASINNAPPQFTSDQVTGDSGLGGINPGHRLITDPRNGWIYSMHQACAANCTSDPKSIQYFLNRSTDQGATWTLNGSSSGIVVATANSTQPTPKFGTVNALLGGIDHGAVDPSTGDLYYVYGNEDASGNNRLAIRRISDNGSGGVTVGSENFVVSGTVDAAIPSVAVTRHGAIGVFYYTYNGMVSGFPQFTAWLAVSKDNGVTFSAQPLETFLSPATDNSNNRQRVLGDYMQMKAVDNCFYGSFTGNGAVFGRSVSNNDPIFFKACVGASASTHDFDGNGFSDIAWRDTTGDLALWLMNGASVASAASLGNLGTWSIVGQRDFDGDGDADLLWANGGNLAMWLMNGTTVASNIGLGNVGGTWAVAGTGDFNGDGKGDIFWRDGSGNTAIWLMNGGQVASAAALGNVGGTWSVVATGDFDGDGNADILWRDTSGNVAIWFMNGTTILSVASLGNVGPTWSVVGAGDFDGNGKSDILWRDTGGDVAIWLMNGAAVAPNVGKVQVTGDFDADGTSDILWSDSSGDIALWFMNGGSVSSSVLVASVPTAWTIQGSNAD